MDADGAMVNNTELTEFFTCPLCDKYFNDATTIIECLHTFCRKCIEKKLTVGQSTRCPVCKLDLGCSPLVKLRPDRSVRHMTDKLFSSEGKNVKTPESVAASSTPLVTKKKNSGSFSKSNAEEAKSASKRAKIDVRKGKQVLEEPKQEQEPKSPVSEVAMVEKDVKKDGKQQCGIEILDKVSTILSARRAKSVARKKFISPELVPTAQPAKVAVDEKKDDNRPRTRLETLKNSSKPESSPGQVFKNFSWNSTKSRKEKPELRDPLSWLVEPANNNKSTNNSTMPDSEKNNSTKQQNDLIPVVVDSSDNESHETEVRLKKRRSQLKGAASHQNESVPPKPSSLKLTFKKVDLNQEKRVKFTEDLNLPPQPENESNKALGPIWFSLVASKHWEVSAPLPQISPSYLRVKNGNLHVSYIKKYLVQKLGLASEAEVQVLVGGKPMLSSMQLHNLRDFWLQTKTDNGSIETSLGSSAKDFVMVLSYCRRA